MGAHRPSPTRVNGVWRSAALPVLLGALGLSLGLLMADAVLRDTLESFPTTRWNVDQDRSYLEILGFVLTGAAALTLGRAARVQPAASVLGAWGAVLVVVVLDDALELHERYGAKLAYHLPLPQSFGLREQDFGELAVWGALGVGALALLAHTHRRSGAAARRAAWALAALMALLLVPAVVLDMAHIVAEGAGLSEGSLLWLTYAEALGEVWAMAGFLALARHLLRRAKRPAVAVLPVIAGMTPPSIAATSQVSDGYDRTA